MPYLLKTVSATRQDFNFIVSFSSNIMETSFSIILQSINLLFESIRQSRKMLQFLYVCVCALNECALTSVRLVSFHRGGHWLQPCADSPVTRLAERFSSAVWAGKQRPTRWSSISASSARSPVSTWRWTIWAVGRAGSRSSLSPSRP